MSVRHGAATHIGQVRDHNEDGLLCAPPLFAVADGMGGHLGGEVASAVALETLARRWEADGIAGGVRAANDAVYGRALKDHSVAGMGTTLTALTVGSDSVEIAHVGDSRAYLLRGGQLRALTDDHTMVGEMVRAGEITEAQARVHPRRSILTRAVGIDPNIAVDAVTVPTESGDRLLLCSDGLCGMIEDDAIADILRGTPDPQAAADALVVAANEAGGFDNVTAVVLILDDDIQDPSPTVAEPDHTSEQRPDHEPEQEPDHDPEQEPVRGLLARFRRGT